MKASAEDKLSALIHLARLLLPISYGDAESLFNEAIEVAGEVNSEAVHELALFAPFAEHAVGKMSVDHRRAVARDLAIVVGDTGVRLAGHDHFPWDEAAQALTALDVCLALAAVARWEDSNLVEGATLLSPLLETALRRRELSPMQVAAFSSLLNQLTTDLIIRIGEEASGQSGSLDLQALIEDLAREELLRFGRGTRPQVSKKLISLLTQSSPGFWLDRLVQATAFHQVERPGRTSAPREEEWPRRRDEAAAERPDPLDSITWAAHCFVSAADIHDVIGRVFAAARASEAFVPISTVLDRIETVIALGNRVVHLEALSRSESPQMPDYELAQAIARRIDGWYEAPSVSRWCRERLMQVVVDLLPGFSRWLVYGQSPLPALLKKSGVPGHQICAALLEGMERHVDALSAPTVYALVGLVGQYCMPDDAAQVITRYADRLVQRIPVPERDPWDLTDIPIEAAGGVARFLYACMGDVDVRIRWRAAHALRRLAHLGDTGILDKLIELYNQTSEPSYRKPEAPFYWLAARLWLVMALDRIAAETPSAVRRHGPRLLAIASDNEFPHVLVRSFAQSAVCKLVESGVLALDSTQRDTLKRVNTSPVRRKKARRSYRVDRRAHKRREDRRFYFDTLDTLPYWYSRPLRVFADLDEEEFLDVAERWIIDCWGVRGEAWRWDEEPRKGRFSERSFSSMDHNHGSRPTLERFHTYLEWHAMWCATGELMRTRALVKAGEDDYDTFEYWLGREGLTSPPLWLADLHGPKPLADRLWFSPHGDVDRWIEDVGDDDFLTEIGLAVREGSIIVSGSYDTRSSNFMESARIETALVSPDTASALVRALQTIDNPWRYRIPPAGGDLEIDAPPYKLVGWLVDVRHESEIDERDPLRYDVHAVECRPARDAETSLNLTFVYHEQAKWIEVSRRQTAFVYETWGDTRGDEHDDKLRYDDSVRSHGWRLQADKEALQTFLNEMGLDLIVEIQISRRNKGYDYARYDEEKAKEARFDRIILLRRDGTIEAAEGRLGTWTAPRA